LEPQFELTLSLATRELIED